MASVIRDLASSTPEMAEAFGDAATISAALRFEAALAAAEAAEGLIPAASASAIAKACDAIEIDIDALAAEAAHAGTLAIPLVARLREAVARIDPAAAALVHLGATSQDVADTAMMLQAAAGLDLLRRDARRLGDALAALAETHAATSMIGRTLLQPALPITFGLKAAAWLEGVHGALERLDREANSAVVLQLGGAAGSRAGLDGKGAAVASRMAADLQLGDAPLPWHARREAVAGLGAALAILTGALGKIARDVSLMAQAGAGEAFEPAVAGRGGSSAMAHKRNPTGCQVALSAAQRAPHLAATLISTLPAEHERGLGGWQAEGPALADLFMLAHGALAAMADVIEGLDLRPEAMARNLEAAGVGADTGEAQAMALSAARRWRDAHSSREQD